MYPTTHTIFFNKDRPQFTKSMHFDINNIIITFLEYKNLPGGFADFRETLSDSGSLPDNPGGLATLIVSEF